jgi:RND superfamily putative drug exporter
MIRFVVRRPVVVILLWVAVVGAGFTTGIGVFERLVSEVGAVPGSESHRTADRIAAIDPQPETVSAVITGRSADDPAMRSSVERAVADLRAQPGVAQVSDPRPSTTTGQALSVQVALKPENTEEAASAVADRLKQIAPGTVTVAGGPLTDDEFDSQAQSDVQHAEMLSMPVVLVLLLLVFGGLIAAGLPLLIAVMGIGTAFGILYAFSFVSDVSVYSIQVITMLSVGLAVDYALLVVNRFREERGGGGRGPFGKNAAPDIPTAVTRTVATAGRTVLFSGLIVSASLAGLVVFPDPFLRSMGFAGAAVVAVDMLAALTLLPALLVLFGHRIKAARPAPSGGGFFARVARGVQRRPVVTLVVTAAGLAVLALPALDLRLSAGDPRLLPSSSQTRALYDAQAVHFPDQNAPDPYVVLAGTSSGNPALAEFRDRLAAVPGITGVRVDEAAGVTVLRAATSDQPSSDAASRTVQAIRALPAPFNVAVTGDAAELVDYRAMVADRLPWAAAVVVLASLVLLFAFTGSVLLPIKAVLSNLLSIGAALGVVVWVFQQGHLAGLLGSVRLDSTNLTVPVLVAAIAFGLAMDYEMFLLSRIREQWLAGAGAHRAVAEGLQRTGRIVTSAALLLAVVFAGFLVGGFAPIKQVGLGLVLAVALDATVVRMLLVPATMTLFGRYNWWAPAPLRRLHKRFGVAEPEAQLAAAPAT